jgi:hypothetical protein
MGFDVGSIDVMMPVGDQSGSRRDQLGGRMGRDSAVQKTGEQRQDE